MSTLHENAPPVESSTTGQPASPDFRTLGYGDGNEIPDSTFQLRVIWQYTILTYLLLLINGIGFLREVEYTGKLTIFFVGAVYLTYSMMYLLPAFLILLG